MSANFVFVPPPSTPKKNILSTPLSQVTLKIDSSTHYLITKNVPNSVIKFSLPLQPDYLPSLQLVSRPPIMTLMKTE